MAVSSSGLVANMKSRTHPMSPTSAVQPQWRRGPKWQKWLPPKMMMMMNQRSLREGKKRPKRNHLRIEGPTRRNLLQFQQRNLLKGKSLGYLEVENLSGGGKVGTKLCSWTTQRLLWNHSTYSSHRHFYILNFMSMLF